MILLYTDFGTNGPYVGQMKARVHEVRGDVEMVDLMHDAPRFRPREAGLLLAAQLPWLPARAVILAVVDPGVGGERRALVARAGDRWLVGPDNGLLAPALSVAGEDRRVWRIPIGEDVSASFHGRDVFAPAAGRIASTGMPPGAETVSSWVGRDWPVDAAVVIYVDDFGNVMTGRYADALTQDESPVLPGVRRARTFGDVEVGATLWYRNSMGLVEIAVNQGSAAERYGLAIGDPVEFGRGSPGKG
jgi:hypothetical protein